MYETEFTTNLDHTLATMADGGLLLATADGAGVPNAMTIGWGNPGIVWGRPVFIVLVRPSRHTFVNIEATGEFVVSVPSEDMNKVTAVCGSKSGRDVDKFAELDLATVPAQTVAVPLIGGCVRHYECRVIHANDIVDAMLDDAPRREFYPKGDLHRCYYGQILRAVEV
jgi:flavin reductase (DIM6/NTAB) family NADH-FMN oxidoreductase RutF